MTKNPNKLEIPGARNVGHLITAPPTDTPWLVENWIIEGELAVVHGAANTGKSYAVLDMGLHIAFDKKEWARNQIPHWRPVIYIPSEGIRGVERRIRTWLRIHEANYITEWDRWDFETQPVVHYDVDEDGNEVAIEYDKDPEAARPFYIYEGLRDHGWPLLLNEGSKESAATLEDLKVFIQWVAALWERLPVVIVDVVSDFAPGIDENHRDFGHALAKLKPDKLGGASVILVHHEGYSGGRVRGHSSVTGLVDASIGIEARDDSTEAKAATTSWLRLFNGKQRNEERAEPMILTLQKPNPDAEAALITGRPDPETEQKLLPLFARKDRKAVAKAGGGLPFDDKERAFIEALRNGATTPVEIREMTGMVNGTEFNRRKALVERGWITWDGKVIELTSAGDAAFVKQADEGAGGWASYGKEDA